MAVQYFIQQTAEQHGHDPYQNFSHPLLGVSFSDENNGTIVGGTGTIARTTDGGITWNEQVSGTTALLYDVYFTNESSGIVAGSYGTILKTTDGGASWNNLSSGTSANLYGVSYLDINICTVVGENGTILRTTNGGSTWTQQVSGTETILSDVCFIDPNKGTVVGTSGTILRTEDGGSTWTKQISGTTNNLYTVFFLNQEIGAVVGSNGTILRTTNGGVTFTEEDLSENAPEDYYLSNNFPNPFNPSTTIHYSIPYPSNVKIKIYDVIGNEIATLVSEEKQAGSYEAVWNADGLPSGVYFYQLRAGEFMQTKKMILLR